MKNRFPRSLYALLTFRLDQLWFPAAIWLLFAVVLWLVKGNNADVVAMGFMGVALPLLSGILSSYAVLDDPALELTFATPYPAWRLLLSRLGVLLGVDGLCALTFQLFCLALQIDLTRFGDLFTRQFAWLVPCLMMIALGCLAALLMAQSTSGALVVGLVWIVEVMLRGWWMRNEVARYFFFFTGTFAPDHPYLFECQAAVMALALAAFVTAWALLKKQERYI
jgi:hypothetical protein